MSLSSGSAQYCPIHLLKQILKWDFFEIILKVLQIKCFFYDCEMFAAEGSDRGVHEGRKGKVQSFEDCSWSFR